MLCKIESKVIDILFDNKSITIQNRIFLYVFVWNRRQSNKKILRKTS